MEFTKDIKFNCNLVSNQYVTITYTGFLKDSTELTLVYGFNETWEQTTEQKMQKTKDGFETKIKMLDFNIFNFCFKNSENVWDNNHDANYISSILSNEDNQKITSLFEELLSPLPKQPIQQFNIDELIEELLEPIIIKPTPKMQKITPTEVNVNPIDLGVEITKVLSQINDETSAQELVEYSTLDEILAGTVIDETPIELFEESSVDDIVNELIENTIEKSSTTEESTEEKSLVPTKDSFVISPRELSKFYLFRKRLKLAFYKALVKIPKLIFGIEHD